jgi:arylsulfatase A-like enzyme
MTKIRSAGFCLLLFAGAACIPSPPDPSPRPNILLIVADDLGYTDLGSYGGEIETPHLDLLAERGLLFSGFQTAPLCAVSRAMLLSGNNNHIAGMGTQDLRTDMFGYEGRLTDRVVPFPRLLQDAGYHTYIVGKWHLGTTPEANPGQKGFDRSFVLLPGAGNHYDDQGLFSEDPVSPYTEDGKPATWQEGDYSTDFYTDKLIGFIGGNADDNKPFFALAAYTSPHWPLQVDPGYWKKYEGKYDDGYEKLKQRRFENLKRMGLLPAEAVLPPNHLRVKPWAELSAEQRRMEARKMELYAGMVDNLDANIGRLFQYLEQIGELDNTLVVFIADNGAAAEDFFHNEKFGPFIREHFDEDYASMGEPKSFISYGPQWAEAGTGPFKYFKGMTTQGGISAPMIVAGPGIEKNAHAIAAFTTIMDLAPTFYETAGIEYPARFNDEHVYPLKGESLWPLLSGRADAIHSDEYVFAMEHRGQVLIRKGNWKLVNATLPLKQENFELYDLSTDMAEQRDLKSVAPEKFQEMLDEWETLKEETRLQIPTPEAAH